MLTYTLVHAVAYKDGKAIIGNCHIIDKREEVMAASWPERIKKLADRNRIQEETDGTAKL